MSEAQVAQFRSLFASVSEERARELIDACTGNVDEAVELYFAQGGPDAATAAKGSAVPAAVDSDDDVLLCDGPAASAAASSSAASSAAAAAAASKKRKGNGSAASPVASPAKRTKGGKHSTPIKDASQHSLASFFQRSPAASPPAASAAAAAAASSSLPVKTANGSTKLTASDRARAQRLVVSPPPSSSSSPPPCSASASGSVAAASSTAAAAASSSASPAASAVAAVGGAAAAASPSFGSALGAMAASSSSADSDPLKPCWQPGQPVPFVFLSRIWKMIEGENGRIKITNWLAFAFWQILAYTPADLPAALFLSSDQLAPSYQNHQLGIGGSTLVRLVCEITSVSHAKISADHARLGDLGLIAAQYRLTQTLLFRPAPLTVAHVFSTFHALGDVSKRDRKEMMLKKLFAAAREDELLYLIRVAEGSLRIGAVITTVLSALAKAFVLHHLYCEGVASERHWEACSFERVLKATEAVRGAKPGPFVLEEPLRVDASPAARSACIARRLPSYLARATAKLRRAYAELPSFHDILPVLLASSTNIYDLHNHIRLTAGVPIKPQLGRAVTSVMQVLKLFRGMAFTVECKYDGLRAQIHRLSNGTYRIFSRHLMDQGNRWDDLVPLIEAAIMRPDDTQTFIIDAEIVAIQHMAQTAANGSASAAAAAAAASSASASADCSTDAATSAAAPSPSFRILPFQQLATRKRKGDSSTAPLTAEKRVEVSCMVYAFDFLSLNGESLLLRSLPERRALMAETFAERSGEFQFVEHCDISAASASNIVIEELDEEEENEAKIKPRAKAKAKASAKAKPTSLKGAIAAAAVAADAAEEQGSDDDEGSDVEEIDGAGAGSATRADADDELASLQPPAEAKADESAVAASPSGPTPVISDALKSDAVAAAPSASEQIAEFMRTVAIPRGEGIMAKSLSAHSTYEPDVRTDQWCKLKRDYMGGMGVADSIDVVIIGAWHGNGRKAGWLSPFLAAVYNPDNDEYESFAKIMTGFTDAVYKQFTEECMELAVPAPPRYYRVSDSLRPTIWFKPKKVWEIRGADLTISPVHAAARGLVHESRGISLRFPRFIREREDKSIEQCTTSDEIARMYRSQSTVY